jgi:hypothetical protein
MMRNNALKVIMLAAIATVITASTAVAAPTMIRLGYSDCRTCHFSPQGGGLLTAYGKGIDEAQSLRGGEVQGGDTDTRRLLFDVRFVAASSISDGLSTPGTTTSNGFRAMMRSSIRVNERHRVSYTLGVESPRLLTSYRGNVSSTDAIAAIPKAIWEYTPKQGVTIAAGRDELPSGIGLPDPLTFIRRGNDAGQTAYPTQIKASIFTRRLQFTPYVYGPGGDEAAGSREYGAGVVAGVDVWRQHAIVGMTARTGRADASSRQSAGAYARLGFGKWGVLAEHDLTSRTPRATDTPATQFLAGHTQVFAAPYEWLVTSLGVEHLVVSGARDSHVYRLAPTVQARLSSNITAIFYTRDVFTGVTSTRSRTYGVQVAVKTVN